MVWTKMPGVKSVKDLLQPLDEQAKKYIRPIVAEEKNETISKLLLPIENVVHKFSSILLSFFESDFIDNPTDEAIRIKKEYDKCCNIIRSGNNKKHQDLILKLDSKIGNAMVKMEGFVFEYAGKLFKITGSFYSMNRVIATIKYENYKKNENPNNMPLSLFMQSS